MKRTTTENIIENVARQPINKTSIDWLQDLTEDSIVAVTVAMGIPQTGLVLVYDKNDNAAGVQYVYIQGKMYLRRTDLDDVVVDPITKGVYTIGTTFAATDPVTMDISGEQKNVHEDNYIKISNTAKIGSGNIMDVGNEKVYGFVFKKILTADTPYDFVSQDAGNTVDTEGGVIILKNDVLYVNVYVRLVNVPVASETFIYSEFIDNLLVNEGFSVSDFGVAGFINQKEGLNININTLTILNGFGTYGHDFVLRTLIGVKDIQVNLSIPVTSTKYFM